MNIELTLRSDTAIDTSPENIYVVNNLAYIFSTCWQNVTPIPTLQIYDVTNQKLPVHKSTTNLDPESRIMFFDSGYIYITSYLGGLGTNSLFIYDVSNPNLPFLLGSLVLEESTSDLIVAGNFAYLVRVNGNPIVIDITNKYNPICVGEMLLPIYSQPGMLIISGDYLYCFGGNLDTLDIYNISDKFFPALISSTLVGSPLQGMIKHLNFIVIFESSGNKLHVCDVTSNFAPILLNTISLDNVNALSIVGNFMYVASLTTNIFSVYDISDILNITLKNTLNCGVDTYQISSVSRFSYLVNATSNNLQIFELTTKHSPATMQLCNFHSPINSLGI